MQSAAYEKKVRELPSPKSCEVLHHRGREKGLEGKGENSPTLRDSEARRTPRRRQNIMLHPTGGDFCQSKSGFVRWRGREDFGLGRETRKGLFCDKKSDSAQGFACRPFLGANAKGGHRKSKGGNSLNLLGKDDQEEAVLVPSLSSTRSTSKSDKGGRGMKRMGRLLREN